MLEVYWLYAYQLQLFFTMSANAYEHGDQIAGTILTIISTIILYLAYFVLVDSHLETPISHIISYLHPNSILLSHFSLKKNRKPRKAPEKVQEVKVSPRSSPIISPIETEA